MKILIIGPQGSGKSTQAELLAQELKLPYLSTGEIFRQMAKAPTSLGQKIKKLLNQGLLVDDETTIKLVKEYLKKPAFRVGFVAEGFPRNLNQAKKLKKLFDKVFYLKVSQPVIIKRLTNRRVCQNCQANFNLLTQPPQKKGICDFCAGELILREDDTEKAIKKRLEIYRQDTEPVLDFYRGQGILEEIDGERPVKVILKDIHSRLYSN